WQANPTPQHALDEGIAFITVNMMEDVVDRGTASSVRRRGFAHAAAGKTGTTNDGKDVWFVGVTPDLAAGVWLGFDQPTTIMSNAAGGSLAAPIWAEMMKTAYENRAPPPHWAPPVNLVSASVDTETGYLARPQCPGDHVRIEYYLSGTQPLEYCPLHRGGAARVVNKLLNGLRRIF
ncbi:MAG: penicillin-binding transpeptidase domain-containing protein, partial [Longimicrobiales bacterium]